MPNKSIHFPEEVLDDIDEERGDQSRSAWVVEACRRELDGEYDDLGDLTERVEELIDRVESIEETQIGLVNFVDGATHWEPAGSRIFGYSGDKSTENEESQIDADNDG